MRLITRIALTTAFFGLVCGASAFYATRPAEAGGG